MTQVDRMICYRVTAAANLKNVVLRKTRLRALLLYKLKKRQYLNIKKKLFYL